MVRGEPNHARGYEGCYYAGFPELLELVRRRVIDSKQVTTRSFALEDINEALEYIKIRGDHDPGWPCMPWNDDSGTDNCEKSREEL